MITAAFRTWDDSIPRPRAASQLAGIALHWSEDYTLTVRNDGGVIEFSRDLDPNSKREDTADAGLADDGFYEVHLQQQIWLPKPLIGLVLPVLSLFDPLPEGTFRDFPGIVPALLDIERPNEPLTIRCRVPHVGQEQVFYAGMPFCQIVPTPRGTIAMRPLTNDELAACETRQ